MKFLLSLFSAIFLLQSGLSLAEPTRVFSSEPKLPSRVVELNDSWSVGGEDGDLIFGMMIDSLEDDDKNVYMLDSQLGHVEVFSVTGEHLRTISGTGEGPGEVNNPQCLVYFEEPAIGIVELFPAKFAVLALDGTPKESLKIGGEGGPQTGFSAAVGAWNRGGTLTISAQRTVPSETGQARIHYLARISPTGEELTRYREARMTMDFSEIKFVETEMIPDFFLANTVGNDGRVYAASSREKYEIEVFNADGSLDMVIGRKFQNRKRTKDEMRRMNALVDAWFQGIPGEIAKDIEANEPPIVEMHVDEEGVLWVLNSRSGTDQADGIFQTYDTFLPDGTWLQEVSFKADADPVYDGIKFLGEDRALLIKGYLLARWASRGARNVDFGEDTEVAAMEIFHCRMVDQ